MGVHGAIPSWLAVVQYASYPFLVGTPCNWVNMQALSVKQLHTVSTSVGASEHTSWTACKQSLVLARTASRPKAQPAFPGPDALNTEGRFLFWTRQGGKVEEVPSFGLQQQHNAHGAPQQVLTPAKTPQRLPPTSRGPCTFQCLFQHHKSFLLFSHIPICVMESEIQVVQPALHPPATRSLTACGLPLQMRQWHHGTMLINDHRSPWEPGHGRALRALPRGQSA